MLRPECLREPHGELVAERAGGKQFVDGRGLSVSGRERGTPDDASGMCQRCQVQVVQVAQMCLIRQATRLVEWGWRQRPRSCHDAA